jgi:dihydroflavonol-4-reductase
MTRALVTGATGFLGASVARVLLERGRDVRLLVRPTSDCSNIAGLDVEIHVGDLRDAAAVSAAVARCGEVYHVGAEYRFWSEHATPMYESNVGGTANVMEACLEHDVERVVYTSTVGTIGLGAVGPMGACDERSPMAPGQISGHYKRSKLEAEETALAYVSQGLPLVVVNPSAPMGPWDRKPTPTGQIIVDFMRGHMPAYVDTGLNVVHARDVAIGHVLAAERGRVGERYILGNRNMSLADILATLGKLTGRAAPKIRIPHGVAWLAAAVSTTIADRFTRRPPGIAIEAVRMAKYKMYFSAAKAVAELGLPQTDVERAFIDALDWFSARGYFDSNRAKTSNTGGRAWQSR